MVAVAADLLRQQLQPIICGNTISGNSTYGPGGGICCDGDNPSISGNIISENSAGDGGGFLAGMAAPS